MVRVYTNPVNIPVRLRHVNTNPGDLHHFRWYMERFGDTVESVLLDTGVHTIFYDPDVKDYPPGFIRRYVRAINRVSKMLDRYGNIELYYVIPDVPSDYPGREKYYPWNVERTVEYIIFFEKIEKDLPGQALPVVQGRENDPWSTLQTWKEYHHVYEKYEYVALGPTCSSRNIRQLALQIKMFDTLMRREHKKYHAFGVHLSTFKYMVRRNVKLYSLRSLDSSSYWFDIKYRHGRRKTREQMAEIVREKIGKLELAVSLVVARP